MYKISDRGDVPPFESSWRIGLALSTGWFVRKVGSSSPTEGVGFVFPCFRSKRNKDSTGMPSLPFLVNFSDGVHIEILNKKIKITEIETQIFLEY